MRILSTKDAKDREKDKEKETVQVETTFGKNLNITPQQQQAISKLTIQSEIKETPHQVIQLPSKGYGYSEDSILRQGKIRMKYPTAYNESILNSQNLIQKGTVLDEFLRSIIIQKIDIDDLLLGDKNYLVYAARILTYGTQIQYEFTCQQSTCNQTFKDTIDLSKLQPKDISPLFEMEKTDVFKFQLPHSKSDIKFKFLDGHLYKAIQKRVKQSKDKTSELYFTLASRMVEYDGQTEYPKILAKVKNMSTLDSKAFREYLNLIQPNIDIRHTITCPYCQHQEERYISINIDFFWLKQL